MASCGPPGNFGNRFRNVGIGTAAADVAAHAFAQFGIGQLRRHIQIRRDVTGNAGLDLGDDGDGRTDLPGRAVTALIAIVRHRPFRCISTSVKYSTKQSRLVDPAVLQFASLCMMADENGGHQMPFANVEFVS